MSNQTNGNTNKNKLLAPFAYNLIYIYEIPDEDHRHCLKIGKASYTTNEKVDINEENTDLLNKCARERINKQTGTPAVRYYLKHAEWAVKEETIGDKKELVAFLDDDVHEVLLNSGIKRAKFELDANPREWFRVELQTAINAIKAVKAGRESLNNSEINLPFKGITLYPNQEAAVTKTIKTFKHSNSMLWDAKMRFGKTITALELIKRLSKQSNVYGEIKKVIIATHRPDVIEQWFEDFRKVFYEKDSTWKFGSKVKGFGLPIEKLINYNNIICFASLQDLRGAKLVGGSFVKNQELYDTKWDLLIIDEAHEGTLTERGENVFNELIDKSKEHKTKVLRLSGTPFNIIDQYDKDEIYSWSYIDEQEAKQNWNYFLNPKNPYAKMPKMNVYTYDLGTIINNPHYLDDKMFNFGEFFRVWTGNKDEDIADDGSCITVSRDKIGSFVHEQDVNNFLNLLSKEDEGNNYPFSTKEYQDYFKHTLWMLPGVKEAAALEKLLYNHPVFGNGNFKIVNVAGDGSEIEENNEEAIRKTKRALDKVKNAIKNNERTITLTCQRLTTGVTVPEWTAVFMLYGSSVVSAQRYMQTIFRVQSPANIDGKIKENCFVFEFAPDRSLKVLAKAAHLSHQAGKVNSPETKKVMEKLLQFCPVIAINGSQMNAYDVPMMIKQLKSAYIDDIVDSGFENKRIYNLEQLRLENIDLKDFEGCDQILKGATQTKLSKKVIVNENDLDKKGSSTIKIKERQLKTLEQREKEREAQNAVKILNAIMTKVPLMVYGLTLADNVNITYDNFTTLINDASWNEFMPKDATKEKFKLFKKYIDIEMFELCNEELRNQVNAANKLSINERIKRLTPLFLKFRNPDKETVLTPWKVVNMHMGDCLGGYNFYNENYQVVLDEPRFIDRGQVTNQVIKNTDAKVLEINSKTGLYPLYITYSLFRERLKSPLEHRNEKAIWKETVENNIFVVCRTEMAENITKRTLIGDDKNIKVNIMTIDNMIEQLKSKPEDVLSKILNKVEWNIQGGGKMKFDAIIGNPPYQGTNHAQVYPFFYLASIKLSNNYVSLIFPTGWQEPKNGNNLGKLNTPEIKQDRQIVFIDNKHNVFPGISGAEWVNIILWKKGSDNRLDGKQLIYIDGENPTQKVLDYEAKIEDKPKEIVCLYECVKKQNFEALQKLTSSRKPYGLATNVFEDYIKYGLGSMQKEKLSDNDIKIYGAKENRFVSKDYVLPKKTKAFNKFKVFVPYAWGNMSKNAGLGGAYADIIIASPYEICTETYLESGCFDDFKTAQKHAKYLLTKFARALLFLNKTSQHSTTAWGAVPVQDYHEDWWDKSIAEIDKELIKKYDVPSDIADFIDKNIQKKTEINIINFNNNN